MNVRIMALVALACAAVAAGHAHAVQTVTFANLTRNGVAISGPVFVANGDRVKFDASLVANGASNPPGTAGLGLCLEYKRSAAGDPAIGNLLQTGLVADGVPTALGNCDKAGAAAVAGADFMVVKGWVALSGGWPNVALPVKLYDAQFTLTATPAGPMRIGFGASTAAAGQTFATNGPLLLCGKPMVALTRNANGSESGPTAIGFDVILSAPVTAECAPGGTFVVTLTLAGTATVPGQPNADYAIGGAGVSGAGASITAAFPANGLTTLVTISAMPVMDGLAEGSETVTLTVAAGNGNYAGVGNIASGSIADSAPPPAVVEYLDTADFPDSPGGHFFYSSDPAEQAAVDAGAAGQFHRTGREFLTGGTAPVCRFYGSLAPGPNSHFFTVDMAECNALKAAQITPAPATVQQWNYERIEYFSTPAIAAANGARSCPPNTQPLYRAYNDAYPLSGPKNPWDSNHRFTPVQADIVAMVAQGWRDEGIAFCAAQ
ncbi:MAG: hypothetical protein IPI73_12885 [Betaproteobacteria bacterium]|nr:hypothetical protein [Betaproteobacteria bacterium]